MPMDPPSATISAVKKLAITRARRLLVRPLSDGRLRKGRWYANEAGGTPCSSERGRSRSVSSQQSHQKGIPYNKTRTVSRSYTVLGCSVQYAKESRQSLECCRLWLIDKIGDRAISDALNNLIDDREWYQKPFLGAHGLAESVLDRNV